MQAQHLSSMHAAEKSSPYHAISTLAYHAKSASSPQLASVYHSTLKQVNGSSCWAPHSMDGPSRVPDLSHAHQSPAGVYFATAAAL